MKKVKLKKLSEEEIRKKTWEYFWEQKVEELTEVFRVIFWVILVFAFFTMILGLFELANPGCLELGNTYPLWLTVSSIIYCIFAIILGLIKWIDNNWQKAKMRAEGREKEYYSYPYFY